MCQEVRRNLRGQARRPRPPPSEFVCQLPREESGDRQAGELCNRGWEIQRGSLGPCVNTPREAGLLAAGWTAKLALGLHFSQLGPGATNSNCLRGLPQRQGTEENETSPGPAEPWKSGSFSTGLVENTLGHRTIKL